MYPLDVLLLTNILSAEWKETKIILVCLTIRPVWSLWKDLCVILTSTFQCDEDTIHVSKWQCYKRSIHWKINKMVNGQMKHFLILVSFYSVFIISSFIHHFLLQSLEIKRILFEF